MIDSERTTAAPPLGFLDYCMWKEGDILWLYGWALDLTPGCRIEKIEIFLNGTVVATPSPSLQRPDIVQYFQKEVGDRSKEFLLSGWSAETPMPKPFRPYHDLLAVKVTSSSGLESEVRRGKLNSMLTFDL